MSRRVIILGAGISGLACAWFLKKKWGSDLQLTILEKNSRVGGWIETVEKEGFLFELGPRSCRTKGNGIATLQLIEDLNLQDEIIAADRSAQTRYLYYQQQLQRIPSNPFACLFSPLMKGVLPALWHEWRTPKSQKEDESIYDFISRRLSSELAERFMDPLISGIYAGDIRKLSLRACFPLFHQLEQTHGSFIKGLFKHKHSTISTSAFVQKWQKESIFSFKNGMNTLPETLFKQLEDRIRFNCTPQHLHFHQKGVSVQLANEEVLEADYLFSTLSAKDLSLLFQSTDPELALLLNQLTYATVAVVGLGYKESILTKSGFGYLVPFQEGEDVLGCVWDSSAFPQQNRNQQETRLTFMLGGTQHSKVENWTEEECLLKALNAAYKHLNLKISPKVSCFKMAKKAIPQYEVGYFSWLMSVQNKINAISKHISVLGSSFNGVAVNDCIKQAFESATSVHFN